MTLRRGTPRDPSAAVRVDGVRLLHCRAFRCTLVFFPLLFSPSIQNHRDDDDDDEYEAYAANHAANDGSDRGLFAV